MHSQKNMLIPPRASVERPQTIMNFADAIEADRDGKTISFEEFTVAQVKKSSIGGDREINADTAVSGTGLGVFRRLAKHSAVYHRFAPKESKIDTIARTSLAQQMVHRCESHVTSHHLGGSSEISLLGITVGAPE